MARRPEIPEDVFFDASAANRTKNEETRNDSARSQRSRGGGPRSYRRVAPAPGASGRPGRPPDLEGPKVAVTLYLTEPVAQLLEEARYLLMTEHGVKTSKSAIADFALREGLADLARAADALRRD